jgi:hypothetical protein
LDWKAGGRGRHAAFAPAINQDGPKSSQSPSFKRRRAGTIS